MVSCTEEFIFSSYSSAKTPEIFGIRRFSALLLAQAVAKNDPDKMSRALATVYANPTPSTKKNALAGLWLMAGLTATKADYFFPNSTYPIARNITPANVRDEVGKLTALDVSGEANIKDHVLVVKLLEDIKCELNSSAIWQHQDTLKKLSGIK